MESLLGVIIMTVHVMGRSLPRIPDPSSVPAMDDIARGLPIALSLKISPSTHSSAFVVLRL